MPWWSRAGIDVVVIEDCPQVGVLVEQQKTRSEEDVRAVVVVEEVLLLLWEQMLRARHSSAEEDIDGQEEAVSVGAVEELSLPSP